MGTRGPKQCRERWIMQLQPQVKRTKLTKREWKIIVEAQQRLGNKYESTTERCSRWTDGQRSRNFFQGGLPIKSRIIGMHEKESHNDQNLAMTVQVMKRAREQAEDRRCRARLPYRIYQRNEDGVSKINKFHPKRYDSMKKLKIRRIFKKDYQPPLRNNPDPLPRNVRDRRPQEKVLP